MVVLEQVRSRPRVLLVGAVLVLACGALGGCSDLEPARRHNDLEEVPEYLPEPTKP